jgi:hypothetical protein
MVTQPNFAVVEFLIAHARSRSLKNSGAPAMDSEESLAIFDELDSLPSEEFGLVYALYLLGSGVEESPEHTKSKALAAMFEPLELMARDTNLHVVLTQGLVRWSQHAAHG